MVYLIHFSKPFHHAQHYIGYTTNEHYLKSRLKNHANGTGSKLMKAVNEAGIDYEVVRVWKDGDRNFERRLKKCKNAKIVLSSVQSV